MAALGQFLGSGGGSQVLPPLCHPQPLQNLQQLALRSGAHFHRSLERSLEEAQSSGALNLSGRKLKEFPRSAALYDLSDTRHVDLSKNRVNEVALEVCQLVCLESLELYHNCIRTMPEHVVNLRSLTYLNISRNQLTVLPASLCRLPLQVLNASNNKICSLPKETGQLKELSSLDVSCNEIQALPQQVSGLTALRDLSVRRNNLVSLPDELADLCLIHLDFSCNRVLEIPVSFRKLHHLQTFVLDHNPLRSPPAQVCIKGKHHIFKYLNIEACKQSKLPDLQFENRFRASSSNLCLPDEFLAHRPSGLLDSGFNSVDSGNKRWSGNEPSDEESLSTGANVTRETRRREQAPFCNGLAEEVDYIENFACDDNDDDDDVVTPKAEEESGLSTKFMAYIEHRISLDRKEESTSVQDVDGRTGLKEEKSPASVLEVSGQLSPLAINKTVAHPRRDRHFLVTHSASFSEADARRQRISHDVRDPGHSSSLAINSRWRRRSLGDVASGQLDGVISIAGQEVGLHPTLEFQRKREQILLERTRHEAQFARFCFEEERSRPCSVRQDGDTVKSDLITSGGVHQSEFVSHPPGREPRHTDDSSLLLSTADASPAADSSLSKQDFCTPSKEEEKLPDHKGDSPGGNPFGLKLRSDLSTLLQSTMCMRRARILDSQLSNSHFPADDCHTNDISTSVVDQKLQVGPTKPHSFLFRSSFTTNEGPIGGLDGRDPTFTVKRKHTQAREEMELIEQLKKNIESRLKTSLPGDPVNLGSALMDGVVLCHLINQIRPRSVPSIHVPSPAVPKLTMAKCRRNVENFLEACKKLGVAQDHLCLPQHILEEKGLLRVALTVQSLVELVTGGKNYHSAAV
uniref:DISP complex protein LRCH3-like isoform X3 n=1 Tax=Myxine glutinosa TaxID=7769 RepID=UPI00358FAF1E